MLTVSCRMAENLVVRRKNEKRWKVFYLQQREKLNVRNICGRNLVLRECLDRNRILSRVLSRAAWLMDFFSASFLNSVFLSRTGFPTDALSNEEKSTISCTKAKKSQTSHNPTENFLTSCVSRSQCRRRVALGTGVRQVNHSEALGGQQDSMAFIKIRLVRLFTALAVKTRKKRAIFTSEETKTTIMLRARNKKEKQTTKFTSVTFV